MTVRGSLAGVGLAAAIACAGLRVFREAPLRRELRDDAVGVVSVLCADRVCDLGLGHGLKVAQDHVGDGLFVGEREGAEILRDALVDDDL